MEVFYLAAMVTIQQSLLATPLFKPLVVFLIMYNFKYIVRTQCRCLLLCLLFDYAELYDINKINLIKILHLVIRYRITNVKEYIIIIIKAKMAVFFVAGNLK